MKPVQINGCLAYFIDSTINNPSVSLTFDSSLYTREPDETTDFIEILPHLCSYSQNPLHRFRYFFRAFFHMLVEELIIFIAFN